MSRNRDDVTRVAVVVVGDLGRSPRMQAHALALVDHGAEVELVGYAGTPVYPEIEADERIRVHTLRLPAWLSRIPQGRARYIGLTALKLLTQTFQLLSKLLFGIRRPSALLVQNPPFVPTLPVAWAAARCRGSRLVVDWHNFGWAVLAQRLGDSHPIVRSLGLLERSAGGLADTHFCVSAAMRDRLSQHPRLHAPRALRDRPPDWLGRFDASDRQDQLRALGQRLEAPGMQRGDVAIVVCPTSWTADEDFELLLRGIERFDNLLGDELPAGEVPRLRAVFLLTGRGELRDRYESRIAQLSPVMVGVSTAWLSHRDFRILLGCADLGLCVHRSASGLDLPYKVPEMFAAGLPVGVYDYGRVIEECCTPGVDCFTFSSADGLGRGLHDLLGSSAGAKAELARLRKGVVRDPGWHEEWSRVAAGAFDLPAPSPGRPT